MISPSAAATSGGPAEKSDPPSVIITISESSPVIAPCPADAPITTAMVGTLRDNAAISCKSLGAYGCLSKALDARSPAPSNSITSGTRSRWAILASRRRLAWVPRPIDPP